MARRTPCNSIAAPDQAARMPRAHPLKCVNQLAKRHARKRPADTDQRGPEHDRCELLGPQHEEPEFHEPLVHPCGQYPGLSTCDQSEPAPPRRLAYPSTLLVLLTIYESDGIRLACSVIVAPHLDARSQPFKKAIVATCALVELIPLSHF